MTIMAAVAVGCKIGAVLPYSVSIATRTRIYGVNGPLVTWVLIGVDCLLWGVLLVVLPQVWYRPKDGRAF